MRYSSNAKRIHWGTRALLGSLMLAGGLLAWSDEARAVVGESWNGGTGNWGTATNWTPPVVPNNSGVTQYDVTIGNGPSAVSLDIAATINDLTVAASNDSLGINNGESLAVVGAGGGTATINNSGTISLNSSDSTAELRLGGGVVVTLQGRGTVSLSNNALNRILDPFAGTGQLTNVNNTIQGAGNIGVGEMSLVNQASGVINANLSAGLVVQPNGGGVSNQGTLEATNGATLTVVGGTVNNTAGTISASGAGSQVYLTGSVTVTGGTLTTSGGGTIGPFNSITVTLSGVTNQGSYVIPGGSDTVLAAGTITNYGTISLNPGGITTELRVAGGAAVTLNGGGTVSLSNYAGNLIRDPFAGTGQLSNVDNTIQGSGVIGFGQMSLVNKAAGQIIANQSTPLDIYPNGAGVTNTGLLQANGGTLQLDGRSGGAFNNSSGGLNGTIQALNGSQVQLINNADVVGGLLSTDTNPNSIIITPSFHASTLNGVTLTAASNYQGANGSDTNLVGTITNEGTMSLNSAGSTTEFRTLGGKTVTLTGGGTVQLNNAKTIIRDPYAGTGQLVNVNNIIQGSGNIGFAEMSVINQAAGTILANKSSALVINPNGTGFTNNGTVQANSGSTLFVNGKLMNYNAATSTLTGGTYNAFSGTIKLSQASTGSGHVIATNAATILLDGTSAKIADGSGHDILRGFLTTNAAAGHFTIQNSANLTTLGALANAGAITIGANSTLTTTGNYNQSGGSTVLTDKTSTLTTSGGSVNLSGGELAGFGTVNGTVNNTGGIIEPGSDPGIMTINGGLNEGAGVTIHVDIGGPVQGTQYDALNVLGPLGFGGTLDFSLINGFSPSNGEKFELLDYDSASGTFASIPQNAPGYTVHGEYDPTMFFLVFQRNGPGPSPVPEPSSVILLATGLAALGMWGTAHRNRKNRTQGTGPA